MDRLPTLPLSAEALQEGDVVWHYGMRLVVGPVQVFTDRGDLPVYGAASVVTNLEEVREAGLVPMSFLDPSPAGPTWWIQGNRLSTWAVEACA